jgi:hypothetical protein
LPSDADSLTYAEPLNLKASRSYYTDDFMSWDEWIMRNVPVVIDEVYIAMADPAMADLDVNFVWPWLSKFVVKRTKGRPWPSRGECVNVHLSVYHVCHM